MTAKIIQFKKCEFIGFFLVGCGDWCPEKRAGKVQEVTMGKELCSKAKIKYENFLKQLKEQSNDNCHNTSKK